MLFKMGRNNVKHNFKNYWTFYLSCTFSVFVLYLFTSIIYDKNVQNAVSGFKNFMDIFNLGDGLCTAFSAFFIWYSNSFFIKSRKKEFATYMLLGMSKRQVSALNLFENFIIMFLSFLTGIAAGILFNKFFVMLLFTLMHTTGNTAFQISLKSLKFCGIIFGIIFIVITLHSFILIYKNNLIDLFNASKKREKALKVSPLTFLIGIGAVFCLAYGYSIAVVKLGDNLMYTPKVVLLVVAGTILFFTSTISLVIYINKKNEASLFSGTRIISSAQLYYRYKSNVGTLSVIAISTSVALCAILTCCGSYTKAEQNSRNLSPFSIEYLNGNNKTDEIFKDTLSKYPNIKVTSKDSFEFIKLKASTPYSKNDDLFVLDESTFNNINLHHKKNSKLSLSNDSECYLVHINTYGFDTSIKGKDIAINLGGLDYSFKIYGDDTNSFIALEHTNSSIMIVKNNLYKKLKASSEISTFNVTGYMLKNDFIAKDFIHDLDSSMPKENKLLTFYDHYNDSIKLLGILAFVGLFTGVLFLTATGSIIYFKLNTESKEDRNRFFTLRKIGVTKEEIHQAVSKEVLILFGAPFLLGSLNTFAALFPLNKLLGLDVTLSYFVIILVYALFYYIYYVLTLKSYLKNVTEYA